MIEKLGIIGAGQMGNGIAHVAAVAGYDVLLLDVDQGRLDAALETIEKNLARQVRRDQLSAVDKEEALARIATTLDYADFAARTQENFERLFAKAAAWEPAR